MGKTNHENLPAALGGAPVFVQTAESQGKLDPWRQMTEAEAQIAYDMTLRNELSGGTPVVREFEQMWREKHATRFAVSVINGTSAIHSAMFGLGIGPGDEVITPTYNWICSIAPAPMLMARPVFCDIHPQTLMIDPEDARRRITERTRAIVAVHLWGNVCDMDALMKLSEETGVAIIEDCSHAHGAMYKGRPCGSIGHVGAWSLQGSKPTSAGEGGMVGTNDVDIFERACLIGQVNRVAGLDLVTDKYKHLQPLGLGVKFRAHPLGIGIASVQMKKLDELNARRRNHIQTVEAGLAGIRGVQPVAKYEGAEPAGFYGFPIHHDPEEMGGLSTDRFIDALNKEGLRARGNGYPLLHTLPLFADGFDIFTRGRGPLCTPEMGGDYQGYQPGDFPIAEKVCSRLVFLPVFSAPVENAAEQVIAAIRKVAEHAEELAEQVAQAAD
ncbi:MAG: DegT/DnrJ/EryC1/StrS family aminotransferase [Candidatus Poribacteria bacterium]|nr:DegT/DnrJ/EryC1/StrS family aminotransferase [Candidatus Poribacteria bacterium]